MTLIPRSHDGGHSAPGRSFELALGLGERSLGTFVGRERELGLVRERMAQAQSGRGQVVGIRGEPGVGKSRFLYEVSQDLASEEVLYFAGRCVSYASAVPYFPILDIVRQQLGVTERDAPEAIAQKVSSALAAVDMDVSQHAPYVLQFIGAHVEGDAISALGPDTIRSRALEALRQLTQRMSARQPVVLVVEDLHWIDQSSEQYLLYLLEILPKASILLLTSYRSDYRPGWRKRAWTAEIALNRLSRRASLAIVQWACRGGPLSAARTQAIVERAEGHPLFLEELAAAMGVGTDGGAVSVPETIHAVLGARIDQLDPAEQRLLSCAAVLGKDVPAGLLRELTGLSEATFNTGLKKLERGGLLFVLRGGGEREEKEYTFKHALTQESAYQRIPPEERKALHARVVSAVEAQPEHRPIDQAELLAHHAAIAANWEKAVHYLSVAARRNVEHSAHAEAIAQLERALELLPLTPATPHRNEQEIELLLSLGVPLAATKGYSAPEVQQTYARARELCPDVSEHSLSFSAIYGLWRFYLLRAEYSTARDLAKQLLASAERGTDVTCQVLAHRAAGATSLYMGELDGARTHYETVRTFEVAPEAHSRLLAGDVVDPWVASYSYKAWAMWLLGRPDEARREIAAALALARRLEHPFSIALALSFASWLHQFCGDAVRTREHAEEALALSNRHAFRFWIGWGKVMQAWTRMELEQAHDAPELMRDGLAEWEATGSRLGRSYFLALLSEACARLGNAAGAAATLQEAQAFAAASSEQWWQAELHRLQGELHIAAGDDAQAETFMVRALEVARRQGALSLELRAAMSLARLGLRRGHPGDSRRQLEEVVARFTEGFDTSDLKAAQALLDERA